MKTFKSIFGMMAVALMAASCSNDMNDVQAPEQASEVGGIHFTATIAPKNVDPSTRALVEDTENHKLLSNWVVGDKILMVYNLPDEGGKTPTTFTQAEVTEVTSTGAAIIEATFDSRVTDGTSVRMGYPAATYNEELVAEQDGELSDKMDARMGTGTIKVDGTEATLASGAKLDAMYAIVKFTTMDLNGDLFDIQRLDIGDSEGEVFASIIKSDCEIYAVLPPTVDITSTLWFEAWDYDAWACITRGTANLEAGKFYEIDLKLAYVGDVILSDGSFAAPGTDGAVAMIAYLESDPETVYHGLAIALEDAKSAVFGREAEEAIGDWVSKHEMAFGTWCLPSADAFKYMFEGCGGDNYSATITDGMEYDYGDFRDLLKAAKETGDVYSNEDSDQYWTCTMASEETNLMWVYNFKDGKFHSAYWATGMYRARTCLAF